VSEVDAAIGEAVRVRRKELGMRQGDVAERIGVTTQQFQKYEAGDTRIAAAMLMRIAEALDADPDYFLPGQVKRAPPRQSDDVMALQLQRAFVRIRSQRERRMVLDLARRFGEAAPPPKPRRKR
jgi:transcriptional regulator with XRE-family HTH domain